MNKESDINNTGFIRTVYYTNIFQEFYDGLEEKTKKKFDYVIALIKDFKLIYIQTL